MTDLQVFLQHTSIIINKHQNPGAHQYLIVVFFIVLSNFRGRHSKFIFE